MADSKGSEQEKKHLENKTKKKTLIKKKDFRSGKNN